MLVIGLRQFTHVQWISWPFSQFGTYVHELFHGLAAYLGGGGFDHMEVFQQGGGVAYTLSGGSMNTALIAAGGLLGPSLLGAAMLFFSRRFAMTNILLGLMAVLFVTVAFVWAKGTYTVTFSLILAGLFAIMTAIPWRGVTRIFAIFVSLQLSLENLMDFDYMFTKSFIRDGQERLSDTSSIANSLGGAYWFWGSLIAILTISIILCALIWSRPDTEKIDRGPTKLPR